MLSAFLISISLSELCNWGRGGGLGGRGGGDG